jgi:hypothetical protein
MLEFIAVAVPSLGEALGVTILRSYEVLQAIFELATVPMVDFLTHITVMAERVVGVERHRFYVVEYNAQQFVAIHGFKRTIRSGV